MKKFFNFPNVNNKCGETLEKISTKQNLIDLVYNKCFVCPKNIWKN